MPVKARRFTDSRRRYLKDLVIATQVQRMDRTAAIAYIAEHMDGETISKDYLDKLRAALRKTAGDRIAHLQKDRYAYLQVFFDRIDELRVYQDEQWKLFHDNEGRPMIRYACLKELHQLTISIGNYYDVLPSLTSSHTYVSPNITKTSPGPEEEKTGPAEPTTQIPV